MKRSANRSQRPNEIPAWLPEAARNYVIHTELGVSIRALARNQDCHASTILRQIRRYETRRDDPLVDEALRDVADRIRGLKRNTSGELSMLLSQTEYKSSHQDEDQTEAQIERESIRILRRLHETGAVLAVAKDMETAVVVRDLPDGSTTRTATVSQDMARVFALREFIACSTPNARVARYYLTSLGKAELRRLMAADESRASGFAEAQASFSGRNAQHRSEAAMKQPLAESPLAGLARRKDRGGKPFLSKDLVAAGERLREDFEIASMGDQTSQNWQSFLTAGVSAGPRGEGGGSGSARDRVAAALADLGPGLGEVALRCCCYLEGLEKAEKRMGWAARSGKIVLRIALYRLRLHYDSLGKYAPKIG